MKRKVARLRLSPNEEAKLIREEHERRRKLRIQQVREQERYIALQIRRDVQRRRKRELENLAEELRMDWEQQHNEKLRTLQNLYQQSLDLLGMGHRSAKENEPDWVAIAQKKEANNSRAEERYREALKDLKAQQQKGQEKDNRLILTRRSVIELEKKRSAKIASLPALPPHPVLSLDFKGQSRQQSLDLKRQHVVQKSDMGALSSTHYSMPETVVNREAGNSEPDAWELAEQELQRLLELGKEEGREKEQQQEKARLRGNFALMREHLNQERDRLLANLEHLQQTDLLRRRNQVSQMPAQIFQPLYMRQELREDCQRDMEFAFEDMYTGERRVKGDLVLQLVPEPLPEVSTSSQDQDLDLTLEEHLPSEPRPAPGPEEDPLVPETQGGAEPSRPPGGAPRQALRKLLDRIRSQRDQWSAEEAPEKESSMDTGSLASEEGGPERTVEPQCPEDFQTPHVLETTGESVVAGTLLRPEELTEKIHVFEAERKAREEQLEEEKQQQIVLLQELAEQKTRLEAMLLQAQQERRQLQEAVTQGQGPPAGLAFEGRTSSGRWDPDPKPSTSSDEDDHARRIREYQQQLLERNRIHQKSVTVARRRLEEYQRALALRHHMTTSAMLPSAGLRGLVAPQPLSVAEEVPFYPSPPGTAAASSRYPMELPTRENEAMLEQTGHGSNIQPQWGMESRKSPVRLEPSPESRAVHGAVAMARPRNHVLEAVTHHPGKIQRPSSTTHQSAASAPLPPCSERAPSVRVQASAKPGAFLLGPAQPGGLFSAEEVERQRRELQESQRRVQEQRDVLEKQEEEAGELRRRQREALQALLQADEAQSGSEDMAETRLRLLSSLLMAIEESNGNTPPSLQAKQIQDGHVQVPPLAHYPHGRTEVPQPHPPRPPKPPLARPPPGLMELLMPKQHELSVIQEVETPANASLVPDQEKSGIWLPRTESSRPPEQYPSGPMEGAPPSGSEVSSAGERSVDRGSGSISGRSSSKLSWRERLMLEAGASPKPGPAHPGGSSGSAGSSLSVSGAGRHPNTSHFRPPTQPDPVSHLLSPRPFEVDCLSSTTISSGSYATTDPEHPQHSYANTDPEHPQHSYATTDPEHPQHSYATTDPEHPQHNSTRTDGSVLLTRFCVDDGESPSSSHSSSYRQLLSSAASPGHSSSYRQLLSSTASPGHSSSNMQHLSSAASPGHSSPYRQHLSPAASPSSEALQHDRSIQRIIDKYTRELNVSLDLAGTVVDSVAVGPRAARCQAAWEEPCSGESEAMERAMISGARSNPTLSLTDSGAPSLHRDNQVNQILDRLSRQSSLALAQGRDSSFMPLIGQPADESSYYDLDQRGFSMDRLVGQPSDQSSSVGGVLDTSSPASHLIGLLTGQSTSVSVDQRSDSNLSRMIERLSSQSNCQWTSGGQDFYASQLIGHLGGEEERLPGGLEERLHEGREESGMRPLEGELDDSTVHKSEMLPLDLDESSGNRSGMLPLDLDESSSHRSGMMPLDESFGQRSGMLPLDQDESSGQRSGMMLLDLDESSGQRSGMLPLDLDESSGQRSGMMSLDLDESSGQRSGMLPLDLDESSGQRSGMLPLDLDESSGQRRGMLHLDLDESSGQRSGMLPLDLDESSGQRSGVLPLDLDESSGHRRGMMALAGELDESSVHRNGRSGFEPQDAAAPGTTVSEDPGAPAQIGEHSGPVEEPDVQPQSSAVPQVDLQAASTGPQEPETDSDSSGVDSGTDSFRPPPTEVTHNETVDPSMIFHLPDWEEPSSLEESNQSSARQPDRSTQSEESTEREGESQRSSSPDSSPEHLRGADWLSQSQTGLQESLCQLSTSHSHSHHSVLVVSPTAQEAGLAALSLSALPLCEEVPTLDLPSEGEGGGGWSEQQGVPAKVGGAGGAGDGIPGDPSTTKFPIWDIIVGGGEGEKGILEESQLTLVSLTDTTLMGQDVTVSEEAGAQEVTVSEEEEEWHECEEEREEEEEEEAEEKEKVLKELVALNQLPEEDASLKQEKPSHAVIVLGFQSSPSVSLQQAFQAKRRALQQRSHHRVQRIRASRTQSDAALPTRGTQSVMSTTDRAQSQQRTQSVMSTTDRGQTQQRTQSVMSTTDRGQSQQRTQSVMSTTDRGQSQQRTQSVMSTTDRGQTQQRVQPPPLAVRDVQLKKVGQLVICTSEQRKLDKMEMQLRTQRLYSRLEEVKLQKEIRSRQEAYTKNREKAKEFHKKTLQKLRAKHTPR